MTTATIAARRTASVVEDYLRPSLFIPELRTKKKASVLEEMVSTLVTAGVTRHPEAVLDVIRRRESLGSTGLGKGVAIPHGRCTLVTERAVLVARSTRGVDFEAADGAPVHLLFLIVAPPVERDPVYLQLLADLVRGVRLSRVRQRLADAPDFPAVREILVEASHE